MVVCEGVTDIWRVGAPGVAILGKHASDEQVRLLSLGWADKVAVVLLDTDAAAEAAELGRRLRPFLPVVWSS